MDISELIKSYNAEQKNVFTGFCIQLPLCFSILYLYIQSLNLSMYICKSYLRQLLLYYPFTFLLYGYVYVLLYQKEDTN